MSTRIKQICGTALIVAVIGAFVWKSGFRGLRVKVSKQYARAALNPISVAVNNNVPDEEFRDLVVRNPQWVVDASEFPGQNVRFSVLSECVMDRRTNYIRILIEIGADVRDAKALFEKMEDREAVELLTQIQNEVLGSRQSR